MFNVSVCIRRSASVCFTEHNRRVRATLNPEDPAGSGLSTVGGITGAQSGHLCSVYHPEWSD